jgi:uncharacterized protein (DUF885 family)
MPDVHELSERYWDLQLAADPLWASLLGDHRHADTLPDLSADAEAAQISALRDVTAAVSELDATSLPPADRVTRSMLRSEASSEADLLAAGLLELTVAPTIVGPLSRIMESLPQMTLPLPEHAEAQVARYRQLDRYFEQAASRLRDGHAKGRTPPLRSVELTIRAIDLYLAADTDPLLRCTPPPEWSAGEAEAWRDRLAGALLDVGHPGLIAYRDVLATEVAPHARPPQRSGLSWVPDGESAYRASVRRYTTTDAEPEALHRFGLEEIERLAEEYRAIAPAVLGTTDLDEIFGRLRTDPALRFTTAEEVVAHARMALDRANAAVPDWFGTVPTTPCIVVEMAPHEAESGTLAYYMDPAPDGSRPGTYHVNSSEPRTRTRFEAEALAFHEAVPGHHLQIARAQELEGLPRMRRYTLVNAYVEGWALYTERLADEMGLYSGNLERLGMLSFDSWRACRLVVDTGLHHLGWSRAQAVDFMVEHSPQARNNIENEVDRYIAWPGQALGYKVGQHRIWGLRGRAEASLGARFDVRGFHDAVLANAAVPLDVLDEVITRWIREQASS